MSSQTGEVLRVNDFGLCEVALPEGFRTAFTLDKLNGYRGESPRKFGLRKGVKVEVRKDAGGLVESASLVLHAAGS